jgi:hypothetical protein
MACVLALLLSSAIAASTESIVRRLRNNAKDGLCLCHIAAVRRQSSVTAVRTRKCVVEFFHDGTPIIDRVFVLAFGTAPTQVNGARHVRSPAYIAKGSPSAPGLLSFVRQPLRNVITLHPVSGKGNRRAVRGLANDTSRQGPILNVPVGFIQTKVPYTRRRLRRLHDAAIWAPRRPPVYYVRRDRCRHRRRNAVFESGARRRSSQESGGIAHEAIIKSMPKAFACK